MKLIKLIIPIILLSSCISQKQRQKICSECPVIIKDSIREVIKVTSFDTTLFISQMGKDLQFDYAGDCCKVMDSLFAEMGRSNGTITAVNNGIKSSIFKKGKEIVFRCEADSLRDVIKGLRIQIEKSTVEVKTEVLPAKSCEKQHRTKFDDFCRWLFWIICGMVAGIGLWKFGPKLLKLFTKLPL